MPKHANHPGGKMPEKHPAKPPMKHPKKPMHK